MQTQQKGNANTFRGRSGESVPKKIAIATVHVLLSLFKPNQKCFSETQLGGFLAET